MSEKKAADATTLAVIRDWIKGLFYQKPSSGIPKTDLASGVQSSLDKADTALQSHQDISGKVSGPSSAVNNQVAVFDGTTGKVIKDSGFTIGKSVPSNAVFTDTDTKNTAGSTDTNSKIFLIGATTQADNPQTYSQDTAYVGTDGHLYSNGAKVVNVNDELVKYDDSELGNVVLTNADRLNGYASSDFQMALTFDNTPTVSSNNPVKSSGIYTALAGKQSTLVSGTNIKTVNGNSLLGSGNIRIPPTGSFMWFIGNTGQIPTGYLVCNGQAVSRTTYASLYAVIGTKYGVGDGSTTFNLPDLSDGNGRFIRAGFTDSAIGTKQDDAIRNITGTFYGVNYNGYSGAFSSSSHSNIMRSGDGIGAMNYTFDASRVVPTATENRPYNIAFLPLIAY